MTDTDLCEKHIWASVGVATREGTICRIWECEQCPGWTAEPFEADTEVAWDDTWMAAR